jgi:Ca2+-binding RTX toxin-like protein
MAVIIGDNLNNTIPGTNDPDTIEGLGGDDTITGGAGDDTLIGGQGSDSLDGGIDDDLLDGGHGDDTLFGGIGMDTLIGGRGDDSLDGGEESDVYEVGGNQQGFDTYSDSGTGAGDQDTIVFTQNDFDLGLRNFGSGSGIEEIDASGVSGARIVGDNTGDDLNFSTTTLTNIDEIAGGRGNDTIVGSSAADFIDGGRDDDLLMGGSGDDTIVGGRDDDTLDGGEGSDDYLVTNNTDGFDTITDSGTGGGDIDRVLATADDTRFGFAYFGADSGIEEISANGFANATIAGSDLANELDFSTTQLTGILSISGGDGNDVITGTSNNDIIFGDKDNDRITGGAGDDELSGGTGDDDFIAGEGDDLVIGNAGIDRLIFNNSVFDFLITSAGTVTIQDINLTNGNDGLDTLMGVEQAVFTDATVDFSGSNKLPVATDDSGTTNEDTPVAIDVLANDSDPNPNDVLSVSLVNTTNTQGMVTNNGINVTYSPDGQFESLSVGETTTDTFSYLAADSSGGVAAANVTVTITGVNDAPTLGDGTATAVEDGPTVDIDLSVFGDDVDSDDNGTTLTYNLVGGPSEGSASILGTVLTFDPGADFQDLAEGEQRDVAVQVQATDSHLAVSTIADITVTVTGKDEPEIVAPPSSLADLDGTNGFKITGEAAGDQAGFSVSEAGDINDDGIDDLIVGARRNDAGGTDSGAAYVVYGSLGGLGAVNLDDIALGTGGFKITGELAGDIAGFSVSEAGDVNGDSIGDVIVGVRRNDAGGTESGAAYVVYGAAGGLSGVNLDDIALGTGGFKITGEAASDHAGFSVSEAGDVNSDGIDDVIVGANVNDGLGAAYVVYGAAGGLSGVNLDDIAMGVGGLKMSGEAFDDSAGISVSEAGDVNGDGIDDFIVGAFLNDAGGTNSGAAYVVYGAAGGPVVNLDDIAMGTGGFKITGEAAGDIAGWSASAIGDVNNDGFVDLIVGGNNNDAGGSNSGAAYVVYGAASGLSGVNLDDIALGTGGFKIVGEAANHQAGVSVSTAGDINGDGIDDLIVGAAQNDAGGFGAAYVVYGAAGGLTNVNLDDIAVGTGGFRITGEAILDVAGFSVSQAGDVNGDGFDDMIVGAFLNDAGGNDSGAAYVIHGGNFTGAVTHMGSENNDDLGGNAGDNVMIGGLGNDTLSGNGGGDVLRGGHGDDVLAISDLAFQRLIGGSGEDTVRLDGNSLALDLQSIPDSRIVDVEQIDLNGGNNSLVLNHLELANISDHSNTLTVDGDATNAVSADLVGLGFSESSAGGFTEYTDGVLTLRVDDDIDRSGILII